MDCLMAWRYYVGGGISMLLKKLRKEWGKSQLEVANAIGVARNTYGQYETGARTPDVATLVKLSNYFGVPIDVIVRADDELIDSFLDETQESQEKIMHTFVETLYPITIDNISKKYGIQMMKIPEWMKHKKISEKGLPEDCDVSIISQDSSMVNARIYEGDTVFVKIGADDVNNGDIALVEYQERIMLRRVYFLENGILLSAENTEYEPLFITETDQKNVKIIGKAVLDLFGVK